MKTCYLENKKKKKNCKKTECRFWHNKCENKCIISESANGPKTLQTIGDIFGVTRMRICQVEKKILSKLEKLIDKKEI